MQGYIGTGDGGGACGTISLQDIAVKGNSARSKDLHVYHRTQGAADQALNLLGTAADTTIAFARAAGMSCARQHVIFSGNPALAFTFQERWYFLFHAGGTEHARLAHFDQNGTLGMIQEIDGQVDRSKLGVSASINT